MRGGQGREESMTRPSSYRDPVHQVTRQCYLSPIRSRPEQGDGKLAPESIRKIAREPKISSEVVPHVQDVSQLPTQPPWNESVNLPSPAGCLLFDCTPTHTHLLAPKKSSSQGHSVLTSLSLSARPDSCPTAAGLFSSFLSTQTRVPTAVTLKKFPHL